MSWGFPNKADRLSEPGSSWTPAALNHILQAHVVDGALTSFGCVEWESELFRVQCVPVVIHLICLRGAFIPSIQRFANHLAISHASI
jgi:hypothetical protein